MKMVLYPKKLSDEMDYLNKNLWTHQSITNRRLANCGLRNHSHISRNPARWVRAILPQVQSPLPGYRENCQQRQNWRHSYRHCQQDNVHFPRSWLVISVVAIDSEKSNQLTCNALAPWLWSFTMKVGVVRQWSKLKASSDASQIFVNEDLMARHTRLAKHGCKKNKEPSRTLGLSTEKYS